MEWNEKKRRAIAEYRCLAKAVDAMYDKEMSQWSHLLPVLKEIREDAERLLSMTKEVGFLWQYRDPMMLITDINEQAKVISQKVQALL